MCRAMRIVFFFGFAAALGLLSTPQAAAQNKTESVAKKELSNPFFVFNNGVKDEKYDTPEKQARMLKELGYDGMEKNGLDGFHEVRAELDRQGLKLYTVYVHVNLDPDTPHYDQRLPEVIRSLKGRETMLWLLMTSKGKTFSPSAREGDAVAVPLLREIADLAQASGIRIMLYPHIGVWMESVSHAIELVKKVNRRNVGLTFNLCHWLALTKPEEEKSLRPLLEQAMPYLFAVSLNGATHIADKSNRPKWESLIQPLGQGTFDTYGLIRTLRDLGFTGPVGLQCYNVKGDKYENLKTSMATWRQYRQRLRAELNKWIETTNDQGRIPEPSEVAAAKGATKPGGNPNAEAIRKPDEAKSRP